MLVNLDLEQLTRRTGDLGKRSTRDTTDLGDKILVRSRSEDVLPGRSKVRASYYRGLFLSVCV